MKKGLYCTLLSILLTTLVFVLPVINPGEIPQKENEPIDKSPIAITDKSKPKKEPSSSETVIPKSDETVTFIVETDGSSLCDIVLSSGGKYENVYGLICSSDIRQYYDNIKKNQAVIKASVRKMIPTANLDNCYTYNTVINGFSVTAPYSSLSQLKKISGVQEVTLVSSRKMVISEPESQADIDDDNSSITYDDTEETAETNEPNETDVTDNDKENSTDPKDQKNILPESLYSAPETKITHINKVYDKGFNGQGMLIAVIDDSFDTSHEVFHYAPSVLKLSTDKIKTLTSSVAFNTDNSSSVSPNEKIIFAYDYANHDGELLSASSSHGTAVAALIAGNNGDSGANSYRSGAFDAQLALMKVCSDNSRKVSDDVLLAALDDAAKLSPDIVNISLGVPRISMTSELFTKAVKALHDNGSYIVSSAGNYSENTDTSSDKKLNSSYTDYGTISFPSSLQNVMSVGSADTTEHFSDYFITDKKQKIEYKDILTSGAKTSLEFSSLPENTEYIYTDSYGTENSLRLYDLKDKIVVVKRGNISITEKILSAQNAGAAGIIIISTEQDYVRFTAEKHDIYAAAVSPDAEKYFAKNPSGKISVSKEKGLFSSSNNSKPSDFSSYGVTADLRLKPDILAPGTNIYTACNSLYDSITGTSVSAAEITGIAAVISGYAKTILPSSSIEDIHFVTSALMMNTAETIKYNDRLFYTPRLQGAGIVNAEKSMLAAAYVVGSDNHASISMGDSETGKYRFPLIINSLSDKETVYQLSAVCQTDKLVKENGNYYNTLTPESLTEYTEFHFFQNENEITEITIPAGENVEIEAEITLSPAVVIAYMFKAANGFYVDGFITLKPEDDSAVLSVPYMGYCGNWELADIFDKSLYDDSQEPVIHGNTLAAAAATGNTVYGTTLGKNMITGEMSEKNICIGKDTVKNYYDLPKASVSFILPDFYLLRDAADYTITISNSKGMNIYSQNTGTISSFASGGNDPFAELAQSFNNDGLKNIFSTMQEGNYTYTVSASAVAGNTQSAQIQSVSYPFTVDNTPPSKIKTNVYSENNHIYLTAEAEDKNGVQGFIFYSVSVSGGKYKYADKIDDLIYSGYMDKNSYILISQKQTETSVTYTYDITDLYLQLHRVSYYAKTELNEELSNQKIAVRAVDNAFNLSSPVIADAIVSGKVEFTLKDQNDKPVSGAVIRFNNKTAESDENGLVVFNNVLPGDYSVKLVSSPANYTSDFVFGAVFTDVNNIDFSQEILFNFSGVYPETEVSEPSDELPEQPVTTQTDYFENDDSMFALVFISILILIFTVSLITSKKHRIYFDSNSDSEDVPA